MKKSKLNTLVSIASIVSSIALIVSIFILIREYKRSDVMSERTIENLVYDRILQYDKLLIEYPDLAGIVYLASTHPDSLSTIDSMRYLAYEGIFYDSWETIWVGFQNGVVTEDTWNGWNDWFLATYKKKPELSQKGNLENWDQGFRQYMSSVLNGGRN